MTTTRSLGFASGGVATDDRGICRHGRKGECIECNTEAIDRFNAQPGTITVTIRTQTLNEAPKDLKDVRLMRSELIDACNRHVNVELLGREYEIRSITIGKNELLPSEDWRCTISRGTKDVPNDSGYFEAHPTGVDGLVIDVDGEHLEATLWDTAPIRGKFEWSEDAAVISDGEEE